MSLPNPPSLVDPHPPAPTDAPSVAALQSGWARPVEPKQPFITAPERSQAAPTDWRKLSVEHSFGSMADMWVPCIILFILPPCMIICLIVAFPENAFGVLGASMSGLWCFTRYSVRTPFLREKMGASSIMAVHCHYLCCCLLYGIVIYGNDDSWIDYAAKALASLTVLPLAVLFLWWVDTRRWSHGHPCNDPVLCSMFPVLPLVLQVVKDSNGWLHAYRYRPDQTRIMIEEV